MNLGNSPSSSFLGRISALTFFIHTFYQTPIEPFSISHLKTLFWWNSARSYSFDQEDYSHFYNLFPYMNSAGDFHANSNARKRHKKEDERGGNDRNNTKNFLRSGRIAFLISRIVHCQFQGFCPVSPVWTGSCGPHCFLCRTSNPDQSGI